MQPFGVQPDVGVGDFGTEGCLFCSDWMEIAILVEPKPLCFWNGIVALALRQQWQTARHAMPLSLLLRRMVESWWSWFDSEPILCGSIEIKIKPSRNDLEKRFGDQAVWFYHVIYDASILCSQNREAPKVFDSCDRRFLREPNLLVIMQL